MKRLLAYLFLVLALLINTIVLAEEKKMVTIDDTGSHNLKTIDSARSTLEKMNEWMETLAGERGRVGANMQRLLTEKERFEGKFNSQQQIQGLNLLIMDHMKV